MKRHEYVVHYATQNPFEQFVYRVHLSAAEKRKVEREFRRGLREWAVHSYRIEKAELPVVQLETVLEEIREL
jgi:hypothetical protein